MFKLANTQTFNQSLRLLKYPFEHLFEASTYSAYKSTIFLAEMFVPLH